MSPLTEFTQSPDKIEFFCPIFFWFSSRSMFYLGKRPKVFSADWNQQERELGFLCWYTNEGDSDARDRDSARSIRWIVAKCVLFEQTTRIILMHIFLFAMEIFTSASFNGTHTQTRGIEHAKAKHSICTKSKGIFHSSLCLAFDTSLFYRQIGMNEIA